MPGILDHLRLWTTSVDIICPITSRGPDPMTQPLTDAQKMRGLPWLFGHNATNAVFCTLTIFGSVFMLFLDELKLNPRQIGLIVSLMPFCGILAVFVGPWVARLGVKRTYLSLWAARKFTIALLLLTPLAVRWYGTESAVYFVGAIMLVFAVCRAIAETGWLSWNQEIIPNTVRGRVGAVNVILATVASLLAMAIGSLVLDWSTGLQPFLVLFAVGVTFGFISVAAGLRVPGGAPVRADDTPAESLEQMQRALRDNQLLWYLFGQTIVILGQGMLLTYLPLYWKTQVGLTAGQVVRIEVVAGLAAVLGSLPWGWAADRYGSRPVLLVSLAIVSLAMPAGLLIVPHDSRWTFAAAAAVMFLVGIVGIGWGIGQGRILFNSVVPPEHRTAYMSVFYAWIGLVGGISVILGGWVLQQTKGMTFHWFGVTFGQYGPVMIAYAVSSVAAVLIYARVRTVNETSALSFAGMFVRGNPFGAMSALVSYNLAGDEFSRVDTTSRLGRAKSPLAVQELLDALDDPSFNVRHEAIVAIAQTRPDPRLTEALICLLDGDVPDLSISAAWAMGRLRDRRAILPLRDKLTSAYPLLAARCGRSLGAIGDTDSIPLLLARLRDETDDGLRVAYASALGSLRSQAAALEILAFLRNAAPGSVRNELALALGSICGDQRSMFRLWRRVRSDPPTALAKAMRSLQKRLAHANGRHSPPAELARHCAVDFTDGQLDAAAHGLARLIQQVPQADLPPAARAVLPHVCGELSRHGAGRIEFLVLAAEMLRKITQDQSRALEV